MKLLKFVWFLLSVTMIGVGVYFYTNPYQEPKKETTVKKPVEVEPEIKTFAYMGDSIILNDTVTEAEAGSLTKAFAESLGQDSWWWLPHQEITDLSKLGNEYRLAIANYRINIINNSASTEKYITTKNGNKEVMTKTEFNRAWPDVAGLDAPLTDGLPCSSNIKFCNAYYEFNKNTVNYEVNTKLKPVTYLSALQYTEISKTENRYNLALKAVYIEQNADKSYSIYTDPSKVTLLGKSTDVKNETETDAAYYKRISVPFMNKANTYIYTFTNENGSYLFSGYNVRKAQ